MDGWPGLPAEGLLVALVLALFLKDSLWWLRPDEAVLVAAGGGRWRAGFGARGFTLAGREPFLLHPLQLHRPAWRLRWRMAAAPLPAAPLAAPVLSRGLAASVWTSALLLLIVLPLVVLAGVGTAAVLLAVGLLYLNVGLSLALVWRGRTAFGLDGRAFALLAFECLACVPYAPNLLRRAAGARPVAEDFTLAAQRLLAPADWAEARRECLRRIDDQIDAEAEHGPAALALRRTRERLATEAAHDLD